MGKNGGIFKKPDSFTYLIGYFRRPKTVIMIYFTEAKLKQLSIHQTGNPVLDEPYKLSETSIQIEDEMLGNLLQQYFLSPFEKNNEIYHFTHTSGEIELNEMFHFTNNCFNNQEDFHSISQQILKHLHTASDHPKIKSGELYVAYFENLQIEGQNHDAIGIFKSESKESYLTVRAQKQGFELGYEMEAINIKKLDKGCLIFNSEKDSGFKVAIVDQTNRQTDAQYWIDKFLQLRVRNDEFAQTTHTLSIYKDFVKGNMEEEFELSKTDKIDLLNRSMKYFKEKEEFNIDEFAFEVINNERGIEAFKEYKSVYEQESGNAIPDNFQIHPNAVKKQARVYKSVLKLDKNFHIYIHGNNEMIEKGFDENLNLNYYKVYFREEN